MAGIGRSWQYSLEANDFYLSLNGKILLMAEKRIVLVHGWGASASKLEPLASELRKLGWNTFAPRFPGFDFPEPKFAWGVEEYSKYVFELSKKHFLGKKYALFGHSFGGKIVANLVVENPANIDGLVLCAVSGMKRANLAKRSLFLILAKLGSLLKKTPLSLSAKRMLYKFAGEHDYEKTTGIMREIFRKVVAFDLKAAVSRISVDTLVLWGKGDKETLASDSQVLIKLLRKGTLKLFQGEGHRLPYSKPSEVAEAIDKWFTKLG